MQNIGKSGEFAKDWGRREWDGKNRENIFVILPNFQVFSIFAYLVVHTGTGTAHKRTEPVFLWDVHQIDTLSRIMLDYQSKDSRPNKASHIPDLISNEGSTVISAMMYAPDTIHPTG